MKGSDRLRLDAALRKLSGVEVRVQRSVSKDATAVRRFSADMRAEAGTEDDERAADAFIQRFEQLFEITLRRLFPATLRVVDVGNRVDGLLDVLDRLEKLDFISDAATWVRRKDLRDRLVHEYPDNPHKRAADLLVALDEASVILIELDRFRDRILAIPIVGVASDD